MSDTERVSFGVVRSILCVAAFALILGWFLPFGGRATGRDVVLGVTAMALLLLSQFLGWRHNVRKARR